MEFNLNKFVLDTINKMIGEEPDYKVMQYSLNWLNKGVLTELDLASIQAKIEEKNKPVEEGVEEDNTEIDINTLQKL